MKFKVLFALAAASLTMVFACQKTDELGPEEVSIVPSESTYAFPVGGGTYTVELTATVDWTMQGYDEDVQSWLSVSPSSGKASASPQVITIKAIENKGANRKADLVFYGNIMHQAPLTITQEGPEGEWASMTIAEFIEKADTENEYVLTGVVGDIATNEKYWGFSLKDETGTISCPFIGENVSEFKEMGIHTGDKVSIRGVYEFYASDSEHQLLDGVVETHEALDLDAIQTVTVQEFLDAKDMFSLYRMTGTVTGKISAEFASFDLQDETGTVYVYTVNNASEYGSKLKSGDKVTLRGAYTEYNGKNEVVDCTIESLEPGQGGEEPDEDPDPVPGDWIYSNSFNKGIGDFTIDNKVMNDPLTWVWNHDADHECMKASAYVENKNYESESWLISPVIDLKSETSAYLTFEHATNFFNTSTLEDDAAVWAKEDGTENWEKVTGVTYPSSQGWTFVDAGDIDISAYAGKKMQFAFVYKSSSSKAGTWEVKNVVVKDEAEEVVPPTPTPEGTASLTFPDGNQKNVSSYTDTWTAIVDGHTYTIANFNNNNGQWAYIRCGRKSSASVATISNETAMPKLTSIEVTADKIDKADKIKSIELSIYSDAAQENLVVDGITPKEGISAGILAFEIPTANQNADQYYKLTFDCDVAGSNGIIQISKVTYIAAE